MMIIVRRVKSWLEDILLQKLLRNSSQLLGGNILEALLGFLAVVLAARGLGPESYGVLVLIQTYIVIVDSTVNFQSWQAVIKYGADALEEESPKSFKRLIKFGTSLDLGTALLGTVVAIGGIFALETWMHWLQEYASLLVIYSTFVLSNLTGTPIAVLRLFDRFDLLAIQKVAAGFVKFCAVAGAFFVGASLRGYLIAWLVAEVIGHWLLLGMGWRELYRREYSGVGKTSLREVSTTFPGLWGYVWSTNFNGTVKMSVRRFDTLIIGGILGPKSVGLYEVAKKFAKGLGQVTSPLYQAIYPELAKLWSRGDTKEFTRLMTRSSIMAGAGAIIFWFVVVKFGVEILGILFGSNYVNTYEVLVWYILGAVVSVAGFPLMPGMLAMGHPHKSFAIHLGSALLFFGVLPGLLYMYGIVGAGIAYLIYYIVWTISMLLVEYWVLVDVRTRKA